MSRLLFLGDLAVTGFGTVTTALGQALLDAGHDVRFVSQNEISDLAEPFASRTFQIGKVLTLLQEVEAKLAAETEPADETFDDAVARLVDPERAEALGVNSQSLLTEPIVGLLDGSMWPDTWAPEAAIILGDYWGVSHIVMSDPKRTEAFRKVPTFHYVPIEGVDLPPAWKRLWDVIHPVAMSEFGAEQIRMVTGERPCVAYHGVDAATFRPVGQGKWHIGDVKLRTKDDCKRLFGGNAGTRWVLRADRHMPRKRYASLLRGMAPVMARRPDVFLVIHCATVDEGGHLRDQVSKLHPLIARRVVFTGFHDNGIVLDRNLLAALYNAADVYASPSAEGFGLTIAEAMACFPAETQVQAQGVQAGLRRSYTGPIVRLVTGHGVVEATPEHPFWTDNGWKSAGTLTVGSRLLYTSLDGSPTVHAGRIRDVAEAAADSQRQADRVRAGAHIRRDAMGEAHDGPAALVRSGQSTAPRDAHRARIGLPRWPDRRGGNGFDQAPEWAQVEAVLRDREYFPEAVGVANSQAIGSLLRAHEGNYRGRDSVLPMRAIWTLALGDVRSGTPIPGHQASANGDRHPVDAGSDGAGLDGPLERRAIGLHLRDPLSEFATVTAIEYREVRDLPVYNLTTASGTYVAGGFLVHNCGVPCVGMDYSSVTEVIGPGGLLAPVNYLLDNEYDHAWAAVDEQAFGNQVAALLDDPMLRKTLGRKAREHVLSTFTWAGCADVFSTLIRERTAVEAVA